MCIQHCTLCQESPKGRHARRSASLVEITRSKRFYNLQFNRQYPIENYIVDFICRKLKLIIEVDGYSHNFRTDEDAIKDKRLKALGYTVVRIQESEVLSDMPNVIRTLEYYLPDGVLTQLNLPNPLLQLAEDQGE